MTPKISYVIPTRNRIAWFPLCIAGLFAQKDVKPEDIEIIVVDDASTDDTWELLEWFTNKDARIHIIKNATQMGAGHSRNKGALLAQAPIIGICDDDDIYFEDRTKLTLDYFEKNPEMALVNFPYVRVGFNDEQLQTFHGSEFDEKTFLETGSVNYFSNPTAAVRKVDFLAMGGYPSETATKTDDLQFVEAWVKSGRKIGFYANEYVCGHRVLPDSMMANFRGYDPSWSVKNA